MLGWIALAQIMVSNNAREENVAPKSPWKVGFFKPQWLGWNLCLFETP